VFLLLPKVKLPLHLIGGDENSTLLNRLSVRLHFQINNPFDAKSVATIIAINSLCIGTVSQKNAKLILIRYRNSDEVIHGNTITGRTLPILTKPSSGGVFASNSADPTTNYTASQYTVRIKNSFVV
jgi:hypothetical protein